MICKYCNHPIMQTIGGWGIDEDMVTGDKTYFHVECAEMNGQILQEAV